MLPPPEMPATFSLLLNQAASQGHLLCAAPSELAAGHGLPAGALLCTPTSQGALGTPSLLLSHLFYVPVQSVEALGPEAACMLFILCPEETPGAGSRT